MSDPEYEIKGVFQHFSRERAARDKHTDNAFAQLHDSLKAALDSELATTRIASAQFALGMAEQEVLDKEREIVLWQIQAKRVAEFYQRRIDAAKREKFQLEDRVHEKLLALANCQEGLDLTRPEASTWKQVGVNHERSLSGETLVGEVFEERGEYKESGNEGTGRAVDDRSKLFIVEEESEAEGGGEEPRGQELRDEGLGPVADEGEVQDCANTGDEAKDEDNYTKLLTFAQKKVRIRKRASAPGRWQPKTSKQDGDFGSYTDTAVLRAPEEKIGAGAHSEA